MARPSKKTSRPYGRQAKGKTIKSLSIDEDLLKKAEAESKEKGMNFSEYISALIKGTLLVAAFSAIGFHMFRAGTDFSLAALTKTGKAGLSMIARAL